MINEIFLGLAGCFLLGSCYFFKKNKKKKNYKNNVINKNKKSQYSNLNLNPPDYNISNNPIFINNLTNENNQNNENIYIENTPPEYSEN